MWLRSVFLKTLRDYRIPILGWGIGMGLVVVSPMASVATLLSTPQAREQLVGLAATFAWNADVVAVDTIGGYATFKIGMFIFLIAVWPLLAASRMLRGEEDRGALDVLLSVPRSRLVVALEKLAAMWTALLAMGLLIGLLTFAGGQKFGGGFSLGDGLLDLAIHSGGRPGGRLDERTAPRLHRAGHGPPRHSEQRVDLTLLSDLLLQPEQTAGAELRHECRRDAAPARSGPGP